MRVLRMMFTCVVLALIIGTALPLRAQDAGDQFARLRIGYIAIDPTKFDTFIDDQFVPLGLGWAKGDWMTDCGGGPQFPCYSGTAFMAFPTGTHRFAFAPQGKGLEAAVLGPQEFTFESGHAYSLAIIGDLEASSLALLLIDETDAFASADPHEDFMITLVNSFQGAPGLDVYLNNKLIHANLQYGQVTTFTIRDPYTPLRITVAGDRKAVLLDAPAEIEPGVSDLAVMFGASSETMGKQAWNWGYAGPITILEGGTVAIGAAVAGEIAQPYQRVRYTLTLDSSSTLNLYVENAGPRTSWFNHGSMFDAALFVYDEAGVPLAWNDDLSSMAGTGDSGLEGIALRAGTYTIDVGGWADGVAGPYQLIVEAAKSN